MWLLNLLENNYVFAALGEAYLLAPLFVLYPIMRLIKTTPGRRAALVAATSGLLTALTFPLFYLGPMLPDSWVIFALFGVLSFYSFVAVYTLPLYLFLGAVALRRAWRTIEPGQSVRAWSVWDIVVIALSFVPHLLPFLMVTTNAMDS